MARLPALVTAFAEYDPRERSTIDHFARVVREHGGLPTAKRGRGAATMGAPEAAALFIALNGSETPKGAVEALESFRSLPLERVSKRKAHLVPDFLRRALNQKTFGDALSEFFSVIPELRDFMIKTLSGKLNISDEEAWSQIIESSLVLVNLRKVLNGHYAAIEIYFADPEEKLGSENKVDLMNVYGTWGNVDIGGFQDLLKLKRNYRAVSISTYLKPIFNISRTIQPDAWTRDIFRHGWSKELDTHKL